MCLSGDVYGHEIVADTFGLMGIRVDSVGDGWDESGASWVMNGESGLRVR